MRIWFLMEQEGQAGFLQTFVEYPPSQPPASFSIDQIEDGVKKKIAQMQQTQKNVQGAKD